MGKRIEPEIDYGLINPESAPGFWTPFGVFVTAICVLLLLFFAVVGALYVLWIIEGGHR